MKKALILVSVLFIGCAYPTKYATINKLNGDKVTTIELESVVTDILDEANVSGLGLALFQGTNNDLSKLFGVRNSQKGTILNSETVMRGASLSKAVFAYLVAQLVIEGDIDLDKPLQNYLAFP
ncbi:MAG: serine hydrolase domain-containing protein, partial [Cyclobacteriaceae bacterium]